MSLHETIKNQIKDALRAKDTLRLETLRGLNALFQNELLMAKPTTVASIPPLQKGVAKPGDLLTPSTGGGEFLADDKVLALIKRSVKQRKDSIEQFDKGGRKDLADKERAELIILESFMPVMMSREQVKAIVQEKISVLKISGNFDPKSAGKITGMIMKELAGKADGADVKWAVEEMLK